MIKKFAVLLPLAVAVLGSSAAMAVDDASTTINIKADIPTKQFHAQPRDPNFGRDEVLNYNPVSGELSSLRATFDVKNTDGSVHAYIEGGPTAAALYNGSDSIALTNTFNGIVLTGTPQEVVDDPQSTPGTQADLVITPAKPADTQNGLYTGSYAVVFDAVPRTTP
ncbi:adhesin [Pseudomonas sp. NS1(2017)]|uniref:CS1 type fimbrial major subunit n=1 Tax=Pseudomonas TaxID=286 RepID=UPI000BA24C0B|nr:MULTISPECIES: CS1 type fimbrial major subunit [Pseudomonas]ASV36948.1 adhesin [Pseudomonas sp. NS1(2017)]NWA70204.1 adhesin [Pseudomonas reactans]